MVSMSLAEILLASLIAVGGSALLYYMLERRNALGSLHAPLVDDQAIKPTFLFEDKELIDAADGAGRLLLGKLDNMSDWDCVHLVLTEDFPALKQALDDLEPDGSITLVSCFNSNLRLTAAREGKLLRISVIGMDPDKTPELLHKLDQQTQRRELDVLRSIAQSAPQLIWQENDENAVVWCNKAYLTYTDKVAGKDENQVNVWPAKRLFPDLTRPDKRSEVAQKSRHALQLAGDQAEHWFNVISMPGPDGTLHFATDANDQLRSERAQKAFIQTFAKTFAQLSIGLAIFDRSRHLTMFNPALLEMTGLPVSLLSSRPSIDTVLDKMREARKLPEPKDYSIWREQFTRLLDDASDGTYQETWNLPEGQTYRVTGRPHPDGAIAFLFEDISAEVSLTRRFRTELETNQAVLDTLDDAIAVFSPANTLVIMNIAYGEMWGETSKSVSAMDLRSALRSWKAGCAPTTVWNNIEDFASRSVNRTAWKEDVILKNGRVASCQISPITGGMTMVKFVMGREIHRKVHVAHKAAETFAAKG